jgi:hypothetical protein
MNVEGIQLCISPTFLKNRNSIASLLLLIQYARMKLSFTISIERRTNKHSFYALVLRIRICEQKNSAVEKALLGIGDFSCFMSNHDDDVTLRAMEGQKVDRYYSTTTALTMMYVLDWIQKTKDVGDDDDARLKQGRTRAPSVSFLHVNRFTRPIFFHVQLTFSPILHFQILTKNLRHIRILQTHAHTAHMFMTINSIQKSSKAV